MKERMRKALSFLGLIEDEYGDYTAGTPTRPFTDQPAYDEEPEWSQATARPSARPFPTAPAGSGPMPERGAPMTALNATAQAPRLRPVPSSRIRTLAAQPDEELAIFFPVDYNDSRRVTDMLRSNRPIVLNVRDLDADTARRLVDFSAGTIYALNAGIERLASGVYLICPRGTYVGPDAKARLRAAGYRTLGPA